MNNLKAILFVICTFFSVNTLAGNIGLTAEQLQLTEIGSFNNWKKNFPKCIIYDVKLLVSTNQFNNYYTRVIILHKNEPAKCKKQDD